MTELTLSTRDKIDYLEIIKDGNIEHEVRIDDFKKSWWQTSTDQVHRQWLVLGSCGHE